MTYAEQLKHPKWQKKRLKILERDEWACQLCYSKEKQLHVHHHYYERELKAWEYPDDCLISVCSDCHKEAEEFKLRVIKYISSFGLDGWITCATVDFLPSLIKDLDDDFAAAMEDKNIRENG